MGKCKHANITLVIDNAERLRCRHCHLTIKAKELGKGYCPECFESRGKKTDDFETVAVPGGETVRYRCEDCGAWLSPVKT